MVYIHCIQKMWKILYFNNLKQKNRVMELLKELYCIHSNSSHEEKMVEFLINWLFEKLPNANIEMDKTGNLYVTKGESKTYPCIVAHVDQVQTLHSDDFQAVETNDIIFGWSNKNKRHEGLGADDKNGIWVALKCLLKYDVLKVALFVGEEIGCVGSDAADMNFFNDCRFVLQCDRRGYDDFITEASLTELCDKGFTDEVHYEWFGYKKSTGMMTDVMTLKDNGLQVACANISCGYYEPHTDKEFTIKNDLLNCLYLVEYIIENCTKVYPHEYVYKPKPVYGYGYGKYGNSYGTSYGSGYYDSNGLWHSTYNGYNHVCNSQEKTKNEKKVEETQPKANNGIEKFFDTEEDNYLDELANDGLNTVNLSEEMRDEIYDVIYALLNDCPSASYDMIRSAILHTYPQINEKDLSAVYGEVKYDMRKYMQVY